MLEPAAAGRPVVERAQRAGLPHRHLVALAELSGRVPVELERLGQRRAGVRPERAVAGRRGGELGDGAHPDRVVVPAGQQRGPGRRAQGGGVEAGVPQARRRPAARRSACSPDPRTRWRNRSRRRPATPPARWGRLSEAAAARSAGTTCPGPSRRRWSTRPVAGPGSAAPHAGPDRDCSSHASSCLTRHREPRPPARQEPSLGGAGLASPGLGESAVTGWCARKGLPLTPRHQDA